jgi:hypothetical protein
VTVEVYHNCCDLAVPNPYAAILIPYCEDIRVGFALRNRSDGDATAFIFPAADQLAFLYIPAQYFFVRCDDCMANSGAIAIFRRPDDVGSARGDNTERFGVLVFAGGSALSDFFQIN